MKFNYTITIWGLIWLGVLDDCLICLAIQPTLKAEVTSSNLSSLSCVDILKNKNKKARATINNGLVVMFYVPFALYQFLE
jgi:hypothetical protein